MLIDLQEYVKEIAKVYGDRDAYRYIVDDTVVNKTFKEFERDINAFASWLVKKGWVGKHIAIIGSSSYRWVTTFLGVTCSANVVIPIDKMLPEDEMLNLLVMGDADMVFLSEEFAHMADSIKKAKNQVTDILTFYDSDYCPILSTERVELPKIDPEAMAEILFTSGTTGVSKGVMLSQKNIATL